MNLRLVGAALGLVWAVAFGARPVLAQGTTAAAVPDAQKQIDALRSQVGAMQKDLDAIKELLAPLLAKRATLPAPIDLGTRPIKGAAGAPVTLIELTDYQ